MDEGPVNLKPNLRRRRAQLILLIIALGMLVLGLTKFSRNLTPLGSLIYWMVCLGVTLTAMLLALRDMRDIRRQNREQKIGLAEEAFDEVSAEVKEARQKRRANR
ncbi:MAG TPA: hypothetical protein VK850_07345 [Candidatus Binatia bacterium]|nr:hypothetical protein [Candidatus Binatia bacterium]